MTDLNKDQIIECLKAILDSEIDMYHKGPNREDKYIRVRADSLITLREKFKQIKGVYVESG